MKVGFIGLGIMGLHMAKNVLKAGYELCVYDLVQSRVDDVVQAGASPAQSPGEVAAQCDCIIIMVPNSPHVKEVVLGENGVIHSAKRGSVVIDMSSIAPAVSREVSARLADEGIEMIDAPVSGGEPKAIDGTLSIMAGGKKHIFERCEPLLLTMGTSVVYCGEIGAGNTTKLVNQIIVAVNIAAVAEALVLGAKAGVEPEVIFQAIRGGLAGSAVMDAKVPMMLQGDYTPGFRIDLHFKDLDNALETGAAFDVPMEFTKKAREILAELRKKGRGNNDHSGMCEYFERHAGIKISDP